MSARDLHEWKDDDEKDDDAPQTVADSFFSKAEEEEVEEVEEEEEEADEDSDYSKREAEKKRAAARRPIAVDGDDDAKTRRGGKAPVAPPVDSGSDNDDAPLRTSVRDHEIFDAGTKGRWVCKSRKWPEDWMKDGMRAFVRTSISTPQQREAMISWVRLADGETWECYRDAEGVARKIPDKMLEAVWPGPPPKTLTTYNLAGAEIPVFSKTLYHRAAADAVDYTDRKSATLQKSTPPEKAHKAAAPPRARRDDTGGESSQPLCRTEIDPPSKDDLAKGKAIFRNIAKLRAEVEKEENDEQKAEAMEIEHPVSPSQQPDNDDKEPAVSDAMEEEAEDDDEEETEEERKAREKYEEVRRARKAKSGGDSKVSEKRKEDKEFEDFKERRGVALAAAEARREKDLEEAAAKLEEKRRAAKLKEEEAAAAEKKATEKKKTRDDAASPVKTSKKKVAKDDEEEEEEAEKRAAKEKAARAAEKKAAKEEAARAAEKKAAKEEAARAAKKKAAKEAARAEKGKKKVTAADSDDEEAAAAAHIEKRKKMAAKFGGSDDEGHGGADDEEEYEKAVLAEEKKNSAATNGHAKKDARKSSIELPISSQDKKKKAVRPLVTPEFLRVHAHRCEMRKRALAAKEAYPPDETYLYGIEDVKSPEELFAMLTEERGASVTRFILFNFALFMDFGEGVSEVLPARAPGKVLAIPGTEDERYVNLFKYNEDYGVPDADNAAAHNAKLRKKHGDAYVIGENLPTKEVTLTKKHAHIWDYLCALVVQNVVEYPHYAALQKLEDREERFVGHYGPGRGPLVELAATKTIGELARVCLATKKLKTAPAALIELFDMMFPLVAELKRVKAAEESAAKKKDDSKSDSKKKSSKKDSANDSKSDSKKSSKKDAKSDSKKDSKKSSKKDSKSDSKSDSKKSSKKRTHDDSSDDDEDRAASKRKRSEDSD